LASISKPGFFSVKHLRTIQIPPVSVSAQVDGQGCDIVKNAGLCGQQPGNAAPQGMYAVLPVQDGNDRAVLGGERQSAAAAEARAESVAAELNASMSSAYCPSVTLP
jgi:hypothetical protein